MSVPLVVIFMHAARETSHITVVALCLKRFDISGLESMTEPSRNLIGDSVVYFRHQPGMSGALTPSDTYLLTPWSRVLLQKLTGSAASQEIPHIFGTRRFITVLTSARHLSLS